jgi:hypothetical protein
VNLLRQVEAAVANGRRAAQACKEAEIVEQTYFCGRKEYGVLQVTRRKTWRPDPTTGKLQSKARDNHKSLKKLRITLSENSAIPRDGTNYLRLGH